MSNSDEHLREMAKIFRKNSDIADSSNDLVIKKFRELQMKKYNTTNRRMSVNFHNTAAASTFSADKRSKKTNKSNF